MRKLKTEENEIAKLIKNGNADTIEAFKMMTACIYIYDELNGSSHLKNVKKLYLHRNNESLTKLSDTLFTGDRSLTRYRKKYIKCFKTCEKVTKNLKGFFKFLNELI